MEHPDDREWLMPVKEEFLEARASRMRQADHVYPKTVRAVVDEMLARWFHPPAADPGETLIDYMAREQRLIADLSPTKRRLYFEMQGEEQHLAHIKESHARLAAKEQRTRVV